MKSLAAFLAPASPPLSADECRRLHAMTIWLARLNTVTSLGGSLCFACVIAVNYQAPQLTIRLIAMVCYIASMTVLHRTGSGFLRTTLPILDIGRWLRRFTILSFVTGLAWAILFLSCFEVLRSFESISTMAIIAAVITSGTVTRAPHMPAFFAFTTPIVLTWIMIFLLEGTLTSVFFAAGSAVYWWINIRLARQLNMTYREIIDLRFQNEDLVTQLVTEQKAFEQARISAEEARDQARYANQVKSNFLANMSHELRTPLNSILGFSELIAEAMRGPVGSQKHAEYAEIIHESGQHLLQLINDLLDSAKVEAGKWEMHPEPLQADQLVGEAVRILWGAAMHSNLSLTTELEPLRVHADRRAVRQILLNLLSNAIKFTPAGGTVTVTAREEDGLVAVSVTDTGIGIEAHNLDRVLRPFEQIDSATTRNQTGTGLGLSLSKSLTELMGGTLDLTSVVGTGTTVTIRLPLLSAEAGVETTTGK